MSTPEIFILIIAIYILRFALPAFLLVCIAKLAHRLETHYGRP